MYVYVFVCAIADYLLPGVWQCLVVNEKNTPTHDGDTGLQKGLNWEQQIMGPPPSGARP